jgi:hypothetical protein
VEYAIVRTLQSQSQSQSYFTTGGLPPIISFREQAPWDSRPVIFLLNTCGYSPYATSSLTRGWVCRLQMLLALASAATLRFESRETHDHILRLKFETPPTWRARSPYLYPHEQGGPVIPQALGSLFVCSYDSQCYGGDIRPRLQTGLEHYIIDRLFYSVDRLCDLVVRVSSYRSRGSGFDSRPYHIFWEIGGLERGPLSLVRTTEELLE